MLSALESKGEAGGRIPGSVVLCKGALLSYKENDMSGQLHSYKRYYLEI
jgi:hypothetical protein